MSQSFTALLTFPHWPLHFSRCDEFLSGLFLKSQKTLKRRYILTGFKLLFDEAFKLC